jgi:hypothetical protein
MATNWWEWENDATQSSDEVRQFLSGVEGINQRRLDANDFAQQTEYHSDQVKHQRMARDARSELYNEANTLTQPELANWLLGEHSPLVGAQHFAAWMQRYKENPDEGRRFLDSMGGWEQVLKIHIDDTLHDEALELRNRAFAQNFQHVLDPLLIERMRIDEDLAATVAPGGQPYAASLAARRIMPRIFPWDARNKNEDSPLYDTLILGGLERGIVASGLVVKPASFFIIENFLRFNFGMAGAGHQLARESSAHRYNDARRIRGGDQSSVLIAPETLVGGVGRILTTSAGQDRPVLGGAGRVIGAGLRGFFLFDRYTFEDVFAEVGVEDAALRSILGFVGDVVLDPLTWVTLGAGVGAKIGLAPAGKLLTGARLAKTARVGAVKGGRLGKQGYDAGKHSWAQLSRKGDRYLKEYRDWMVKSQRIPEHEAAGLAREEIAKQIMAGTLPKGILEQGGLKLRAGLPFTNWTREKVIIPGSHFEVAGGWLINQIDTIPHIETVRRGTAQIFRPVHERLSRSTDPTVRNIVRIAPQKMRVADEQALKSSTDLGLAPGIPTELAELRRLGTKIRVLRPKTSDELVENSGLFRRMGRKAARILRGDEYAWKPEIVQQTEDLSMVVKVSDQHRVVLVTLDEAEELARAAARGDIEGIKDGLAKGSARWEMMGRNKPMGLLGGETTEAVARPYRPTWSWSEWIMEELGAAGRPAGTQIDRARPIGEGKLGFERKLAKAGEPEVAQVELYGEGWARQLSEGERSRLLETAVDVAVEESKAATELLVLRRLRGVLDDPGTSPYVASQILKALDAYLDDASRSALDIADIQRRNPEIKNIASKTPEELRALDEADMNKVERDPAWQAAEDERVQGLDDAMNDLNDDLERGVIDEAEFESESADLILGDIPRPVSEHLKLHQMKRFTSERAFDTHYARDIGKAPTTNMNIPGATVIRQELLDAAERGTMKDFYEKYFYQDARGQWRVHQGHNRNALAAAWIDAVLGDQALSRHAQKALLRTPGTSGFGNPLLSRISKTNRGLQRDLGNLDDLGDHPMRDLLQEADVVSTIDDIRTQQGDIAMDAVIQAWDQPDVFDLGEAMSEAGITVLLGTEELAHGATGDIANALHRLRRANPEEAYASDVFLGRPAVRSRSKEWTAKIEAQQRVADEAFRAWPQEIGWRRGLEPDEALPFLDEQMSIFLSEVFPERAKLALGDRMYLSNVTFHTNRLQEFLYGLRPMELSEHTAVQTKIHHQLQMVASLPEAERVQFLELGDLGRALLLDVRRQFGVNTPGLGIPAPTGEDLARNIIRREIFDPGYTLGEVITDDQILDRLFSATRQADSAAELRAAEKAITELAPPEQAAARQALAEGRMGAGAAISEPGGAEVLAEAIRDQQLARARDLPVDIRQPEQARLLTEAGEPIPAAQQPGRVSVLGDEFERMVAARTPATANQRERSIQAKLDLDIWDQADAAYVRQYFKVMEQIREMDRAMGFHYAEIPDYVYHVYKDAPWKVDAVLSAHRDLHPDWALDPATPFTKQRQFRDLKTAIDHGLNPIQDLATIAALRYKASARARVSLDIQGDLAAHYKSKNINKALRDEQRLNPEGFVEFTSDDPVMISRGELRGLQIPREQAEVIRELFGENRGGTLVDKAARNQSVGGRAVQKLLTAYDWGNRMFKSGAVRSVSFTTRNIRTNVLNSFLDIGLFALHPTWNAHALSIMMGRDLDKTMRMKDGTLMKRREVLTGLEDNGITSGAGILGARDFAADTAGLSEVANASQETFRLFRRETPGLRGVAKAGLISDLNVARILYDPQNPVNRLTRSFNTGVESHARAVLYIRNLWLTGGDHAVATERVNKFLFDYQNGLSWSEREVIRRIIPFYTFTRKNIPLVTEYIFREPGRTLFAPKVLTALEEAGGPLVDERVPGGPDADPIGAMAVWQQKQFGVVWGRDDQNRPVILSGWDLPIEELNMLAWGENPLHELGREFLQRTSPWAAGRSLIELWIQKSSFTGGDIDDPEIATYYERLPETFANLPGIRNWLEIETEEYTNLVTGETSTIVRANPSRVYFLVDVLGSIWGARRMTSLVQRWEQANDPDTNAAGILNLTMGLSLNAIDPNNPLTFSKGVREAFSTHKDAEAAAILGFNTRPTAKLASPLYANPGMLRKQLTTIMQTRSINIAKAHERRIAQLEGTEIQIEANRRELAKIFRAPGLQGALDAMRAVVPVRTGIGGATSPDDWAFFHDQQDEAVWQHARAGGGSYTEQTERYWRYQEGILQLERDRIAENFKGRPHLLDISMALWEAEQDYRKLHTIPRFFGLDLAQSREVSSIIAEIRAISGVISKSGRVLEGQFQRQAVMEWAQDRATAENRRRAVANEPLMDPHGHEWNGLVQSQVMQARIALDLAQRKNPAWEQFLQMHPDIQYWFFDGFANMTLEDWRLKKEKYYGRAVGNDTGRGGGSESQQLPAA